MYPHENWAQQLPKRRDCCICDRKLTTEEFHLCIDCYSNGEREYRRLVPLSKSGIEGQRKIADADKLRHEKYNQWIETIIETCRLHGLRLRGHHWSDVSSSLYLEFGALVRVSDHELYSNDGTDIACHLGDFHHDEDIEVLLTAIRSGRFQR